MNDIKKLKALKTAQYYPWLSSIYSLVLVGYLVCLILQKDIVYIEQSFKNIAHSSSFLGGLPILDGLSFLASPQFLLSGLAILVLLIMLDVQRFRRKRKEVKANTRKLHKEIEDLWESKKHLNNKAHTYSGHADKLKLFISDKLLEYIEYDEKFLHFKSIAAEVRHNGVISYDIVTSLLQKLIENSESDQVTEALPNLEKSLDSMRYLWDLLDLSTADNIALHIANLLINAEEHYYQQELEEGELGSDLQASSVENIKADFSSLLAIHSTLQHLVHEPLSINTPILPNVTEGDVSSARWRFNDEQFKVDVRSQQALLGNANHIRLVLENLLKNAQHFSRKVPFKQKSDRILLALTDSNEEGVIDYQIYNRGPQVLEENKQKLFQLGYSTRRTKEHHGKGLGLFFVNEIVKGYEGLLTLDNIDNQADSYSVRIAFKGGKVETNIVNVEVIDQRAVIVGYENETSGTVDLETNGSGKVSQRWQYSEAIESVEISSNRMQKTCHFSSDDGHYKKSESYLQEHEFFDHKLMPPCWSVDIQAKRGGNKTHNVIFNVLDISGVRFSIKLSTAQARLEGLEPSWSEA